MHLSLLNLNDQTKYFTMFFGEDFVSRVKDLSKLIRQAIQGEKANRKYEHIGGWFECN